MYRDDLSRLASAKVIMENVSPSPLANERRHLCSLVAPISSSSAFQRLFLHYLYVSLYFYAIDLLRSVIKREQDWMKNILKRCVVLFFFGEHFCILHFPFILDTLLQYSSIRS